MTEYDKNSSIPFLALVRGSVTEAADEAGKLNFIHLKYIVVVVEISKEYLKQSVYQHTT